MTYVSLSLITTWMTLVVLGVTLAGLVHLLVLAAAAIVFLSGNRARRSAAASPPSEVPESRAANLIVR